MGGRASEASSATPHCSRYHLNHRSHYHLNHPPPLSVEKLSSVKPVPDAKKAGDRRCAIGLTTYHPGATRIT